MGLFDFLMGGGKTDTSGMEAAARESNELQKRIYEESLQRSQPFYDVGVSGLQTLADYLGIGGGTKRSREQIYNQLLPQYTTQNPAVSSGSGKPVMSSEEYVQALSDASPTDQSEIQSRWMAQWADPMDRSKGYAPGYGGTPAQGSSVDYAGLNAAVDAQFGEQGTPDYFGTLLQPFSEETFQTDPGYQFRLSEGEKALERRLASQGKDVTDPAALKELLRFNQGLADQGYNDAFNRYNVSQGNIYNRLAGITGLGETQTAQLNQLGQNYGTNVSNTNVSLANAQAAAQQADRARSQSMFNTLLGAGAQIGGAYLMSDRQLKENIAPVGYDSGYNLYEFNYKGSPQRFVGVLAQEVLEKNPEAVRDVGGFLAVNYDKIGVKMRRVD